MPQINLQQLQLSPNHLELLRILLRQCVPAAEVWAYGSRVTGGCHEGSDLDLVLRNPKQLDCVVDGLEDLTKAIQASLLPMLIDLHLWAGLPEEFKRNIENAYVKIQG